ncbi:MAG: NTP transferase domain-containing protein [Gemmataceae bacterium]
MSLGPRFFALIPAAGKSRRMGRPKLSLPLGDRTVLEHVVGRFRQAGVREVLVVLSPQLTDLEPLATRAGAVTLVMDQQTPDMRATIQTGLQWLLDHRDLNQDYWFLSPADHPTLVAGVVEALQKAISSYPDSSIFIPTYRDQRGHPALVSSEHIRPILEIPEGQGVNRYFRSRGDVTREIPYAKEEILWDLDTPEEYERLRELWSS